MSGLETEKSLIRYYDGLGMVNEFFEGNSKYHADDLFLNCPELRVDFMLTQYADDNPTIYQDIKNNYSISDVHKLMACKRIGSALSIPKK